VEPVAAVIARATTLARNQGHRTISGKGRRR
jgi:hypothetical protein